MANNQSNASTIIACLNEVHDGKSISKTGALYAVRTNRSFVSALSLKLMAQRTDDKATTRGTIKDHIMTVPDGEAFYDEKATLKDITPKNPEQNATYADMVEREASYIENLRRASLCCEGIEALEKNGFEVTLSTLKGKFDSVKKSKKTVCYVRNKANDQMPSVFSQEKLMKVTEASWTPTMGAAEVSATMSTAKKGAANKDKGANGTKIDASKMTEAVVAMDTSIAAYTGDNGLAVSKPAKHNLMLLFARLYNVLTETERADALAAFDKEAASKSETLAA